MSRPDVGGHRVIRRVISHNDSNGATTMTAGPSIDPEEFLHEHLAQASPELDA